MSRIRTIKPEFFNSEDTTALSPLARLFYVSLWCESDREGRFVYKAVTLKNRYFPADKVDIDILMDELTERGMVKLYSFVENQVLGWLPSFKNHQVINNREVQSSLPEYTIDACVTRESGVKAEGRNEGNEGRKGSPTKKQRWGAFKNVLLSENDIEELQKDFPGSWSEWIDKLDVGIEQHGYKYKNHSLTIRQWAKKDGVVPVGEKPVDPDAWREFDPLADRL